MLTYKNVYVMYLDIFNFISDNLYSTYLYVPYSCPKWLSSCVVVDKHV